jgi:Ring finger domain/Leucine Rich repeat
MIKVAALICTVVYSASEDLEERRAERRALLASAAERRILLAAGSGETQPKHEKPIEAHTGAADEPQVATESAEQRFHTADDDCVICYDKLSEESANGPMTVFPAECGHWYHRECLRLWIDSNPHKRTECPLCKAVDPNWEESEAGIADTSYRYQLDDRYRTGPFHLPSTTTDEDLAVFAAANPLTGSLNLMHTQVTDAGLAALAGLIHLQVLSVGFTHVTGTGLGALANLHSLAMLALHDNLLTDEGLSNLPTLPRLTYLALGNTQVTDEGLAHLPNLPMLTFLALDNTQVTAEGRASIRARMPNVEFE